MGVKFSQLPVASSVAADDYIAVLDSSESILKRTPISHASSGTEYGLATTTAYGHTKIVDNLSQSSLTSGNALAARQGNVIANDMAVVELSSKAAHAHAVGDFFMLIGQFVKCTVAIRVGDTITIGVNCQSTNIGAVLSQLNSKIGNTAIPRWLGTTITGSLNSRDLMLAIVSARPESYRSKTAIYTYTSSDYTETQPKSYVATQDCIYLAGVYGSTTARTLSLQVNNVTRLGTRLFDTASKGLFGAGVLKKGDILTLSFDKGDSNARGYFNIQIFGIAM